VIGHRSREESEMSESDATIRYRAAFIIDVMRTHPMIIVGGLLQENPFYTPPEEFLRQLRTRNGNAAVT
jgi:hypothetical protein